MYSILLRDPERQNRLGNLDVDGWDNIKMNVKNIQYYDIFTTEPAFLISCQHGNKIPNSVCEE